MKRLSLILAGMLFSGTAWAQGPDCQVRPLYHAQSFAESAGPRPGWAAWTIFPDLTKTPTRFLFLAGPMWGKEEEEKIHTRWIEVMGGGIWPMGQGVRPVANIRALNKNRYSLLYLEGQARPKFALASGFFDHTACGEEL